MIDSAIGLVFLVLIVIILIIIIIMNINSGTNSNSNNNKTSNIILNGYNEVPPLQNNVTGSGTIKLFMSDKLYLEYDITGNGYTVPPINSAFYFGNPNEIGNLLHRMDLKYNPMNGSVISIGVWSDLSETDVNNLLNGSVYISIVGNMNGQGVNESIRGQVTNWK